MNFKNRIFVGASIAATAFCLLASESSFAQSSASPREEPAASESDASGSDNLEEIVVTAGLRETRLQDTPIAVTAYTAEKMQADYIDSIDDISVTTPNVTVAGRKSALAAPFIIRGLGANVVGPGLDDPVAQYVDDVYLGRPASGSFNFIDVERVEVLRGPQGTLRGRNSTAGAVVITSRKPSLSGFSGDLDADYGTFRRYNFKGSFNAPLGDRIAIRAGYYKGGYGEGHGRSFNTFLNRPTDRSRGESGRVSVLVKPTDTTELLVIGDMSSFNTAFGFDTIPFSTLIEKYAKGNPLTDDLYSNDLYSESTVHNKGISARVTQELSDTLSLTSITAWRRYRSNGVTDADGSTRAAIAMLPSSLGVRTLDIYQGERQRQFSQELRLTYDGDGPFSVVGGLFYFNETSDATADTYIRGVVPSSLVGRIPGLKFPDILRSYTGEFNNKAWAAFAQADYQFSDKLSLAAGLRYSIETRHADAIQQVPAGYFSSTPITGFVNFRDDIGLKYEDLSPSVGLNYKLNDDVLLYGKISKAFKSGGFNQTLAQDPFGPETLWAYEAGAKADFPDQNLRLNAATFFYDYSDLQATQPGVIAETIIIENAGLAQMYGLELEAQWRPLDGLQINGTMGYLHTEYKDFVSVNGDLSGNRLPGAPAFQASLDVQYAIPLGGWATLSPRLQLKHEGLTYFTPENDRRLAHRPYDILNGYLSLDDTNGVWYARLFFENITNERFLTSAGIRDSLTCRCRVGNGFTTRFSVGLHF